MRPSLESKNLNTATIDIAFGLSNTQSICLSLKLGSTIRDEVRDGGVLLYNGRVRSVIDGSFFSELLFRGLVALLLEVAHHQHIVLLVFELGLLLLLLLGLLLRAGGPLLGWLISARAGGVHHELAEM
jgi:hypothetical protein